MHGDRLSGGGYVTAVPTHDAVDLLAMQCEANSGREVSDRRMPETALLY